nr:endolytic transglycosylase MltG [Streptococcus ovuberis]
MRDLELLKSQNNEEEDHSLKPGLEQHYAEESFTDSLSKEEFYSPNEEFEVDSKGVGSSSSPEYAALKEQLLERLKGNPKEPAVIPNSVSEESFPDIESVATHQEVEVQGTSPFELESDYSGQERTASQTYKVDLTFQPKATSDEEFVELESSVPPIPKRAVDSIAQDLKKPVPTPSGQPVSRRSRSQSVEKKPKKVKKSKTKKIVTAIFGTLFLALLGTAVAGYFFIRSSLGPVDSKATDYLQVEIPRGSSVKQIGQTLEKAGLIRNATVFDLYVKFNNHTGFQSGFHNLQKSMDLDTIIDALKKEGTEAPVVPALGKVTIPEGYTLKQIAAAMETNAASTNQEKSPFTADEFMQVVTDESFISEMQAKYPDLLADLPTADTGVLYRLEGYLFPATYEYQSETTVRQLAEQMLAAMDANLRTYYPTIAEKGLTVNQVLTLASLVEKEGSTDEDRQKIASVFFNRIQWGMPLQSNIAVLYAEGKLGEKITLAEDASINTQIDSPYNVYTRLGYMPGPVNSPSLSAIKATIEPAQTDYVYFVADVTTGQVYFARTLEEHEVNVQTYVNSKIESSTTTQ